MATEQPKITKWRLRQQPKDGDHWRDYARRRNAEWRAVGGSRVAWPFVRLALFFEWAAWVEDVP